MELKDYRESKGNRYGFAVLLAWLPLGGGRDHADSLCVQVIAYATQHMDIAYSTVGADGELDKDASLPLKRITLL